MAVLLSSVPLPAPDWARRYTAGDYPPFAYTADVLAFAVDVTEGTLSGLVIERGRFPYLGLEAWPGGFVEWATDADASAGAMRELQQETGQASVAYMETLDTYDANGRDPRQYAGVAVAGGWEARGARVVSKAFLAAVRSKESPALAPDPTEDAAAASWTDVYTYLPWEDLRGVVGRTAAGRARRALTAAWVSTAPSAHERRARAAQVDTLFGRAKFAGWSEERAPERFALLMHAGLLEEAARDVWGAVLVGSTPSGYGRPLAFDHRRMLADALGRLRGKMKYAPALLASLLGPTVTTSSLHGACEAVAGRPLHRSNLRRAFEGATLLEAQGRVRGGKPGQPAVEFRWGGDVKTRRLDPSLRLPFLAIAGAR
jgi:hypothetical protein